MLNTLFELWLVVLAVVLVFGGRSLLSVFFYYYYYFWCTALFMASMSCKCALAIVYFASIAQAPRRVV